MNCGQPTEKHSPSVFRGAKGALKKVIITGDDFGLALPVNEAIIAAHERGALTAASLMVGEKYFPDAVERARRHPSLGVGLHLTLVEGHPVSPPGTIPDLVNKNGMFPAHLGRAGFRFFFHPGIRNQLEREIRAQFEAFHQTGLELDHVNAHNHMHLHPTLLRLLLKVGRDYGMKAVRVPNEPPVRSWKASQKALGSKFASWIFLFPWLSLMKHLLRTAHIRHNSFFFGMAHSGAMTLELTLRIIGCLPDAVTELCFHPATRRSSEIDRSMPDYRHEEEFLALTSESLNRAVHGAGIQTIAFSDLSQRTGV
jgi:hopanoid biosynthesis associated protein HpnK